MWISVNDPSAGSPTETLLRLLLPLSDVVYLIFRTEHETPYSPKGCVSKHSPGGTAPALNEFTLENVTAALSATGKPVARRAQSAFLLGGRRASLALGFG